MEKKTFDNCFFGEITYKLDGKMRVTDPTYASEKEDDAVYLLINPKQHEHDRCVLCMDTEGFKAYYEMLAKVPKGTPAFEIVKHVLASVVKTKHDKQGKILVPKHLRDFAGIGDEGMVTFRECDDYLEMWSFERLEQKRMKDLSNAAAYRDFARYMNGGISDYSDTAKYNEDVQNTQREIEMLKLTAERDMLRGESND